MKKSNNVCDLCLSKNYRIVFNKKNPTMTSDRKISDKRMVKLECTKCGLIYSQNSISSNKNFNRYKKNYSYNTTDSNSVFFTVIGNQKRSFQIVNWILKVVPSNYIHNAKSIIEVGCGEGALLNEFKKKFPKKQITGFEISEKAIEMGRIKGLDIRPITELKDVKADIVISYAVIEHTNSPRLFMEKISKCLSPKGILILGQPHQDKINYDIFFNDHLFHFSTKHIEQYGRINDLIQIKKSTSFWPIDTFSLHIFRKARSPLKKEIRCNSTVVKRSIVYYEKIFDKINKFLKENHSVTVLGLGEIFSLYYVYSDLKNAKIKFGIDDFPNPELMHYFPVISTKQAKDNDELGPILCCVNKWYYKIILQRFENKKRSIFFPMITNLKNEVE